MNTNCKNCDQAACPHRQAREAFDNYPLHLAVESNPEWIAILNAMYAAERVCESNTVNWRARALAAEAELLALRESLPVWRKVSAHRVWLQAHDGYILGFIDEYGIKFLAYNRQTQAHLGTSNTPEAARRLVELHHGLPACEVLP